jgi:hypothetical protein
METLASLCSDKALRGREEQQGKLEGEWCEVSVSVFAHSSDAKKDSLKKQEGTVCVAKCE